MRANKPFYAILFCLFLFSCGENDNEKDLDSSEYSNLIAYTSYGELIKSEKCSNVPRPEGTYTYPIVPGTEEYLKIHQKGGIKAAVEACRIPENVLKNQSTPAVIQTFFDYPFTFDMHSSNSTLLDGFTNSVKYNDSYAEMLKRKDAGKCLLERYTFFIPVGCAYSSLTTCVFEMLLAQPEFYSQLNTNEKKELVKEVLNKLEIRTDFDPTINYSYGATYLLMGRVMESANFSSFLDEMKTDKKLAEYLESQSYEFEDFNRILSYANLFIN